MKLASPLRLLVSRRRRVRRCKSRPSPRAVVVWFVALVLLLHVAAFAAMELRPALRDPEYGRRASRLKARVADNPDRPLVLVVGSSRTSMGVNPAAWEAVRPPSGPMLFNLSLAGSGPMIELLTLRRILAEGVRPAVVLLEFWPPFMRQDGTYFEPNRIDHHRLFWRDRETVREICPDPPDIESKMLTARLNPIGENRHRWLAQVFPSWLPLSKRLDGSWSHLDPWGWLPGLDEDAARAARLVGSEAYYRPALTGCRVDPKSDWAVRECVKLAKAHGAAVGFVWLPESSEFRGWYPADTEAHSREYITKLCGELGAPLIDAREWVADVRLSDGFHLTRKGAAEFTRKLGPAVTAAFPQLGGAP
jgi:hypothetical protein